MDKYEYRIRAEEINSLIEQGEFSEALKIAETIDWRRVRSVVMLCKVSELYKMNRQYEESKEILLMANDIKPNSRKVIYSLCELSIKLEETVQAVEYYKQYIQIAPRDADRFILQYRLYEAQDVSLEERIAVLEEFKKRDYQEKWAYELAYLYHRIGLATRCVEECDELILWFVDGKYVIKAMELKMLHAPLTPSQQEKYNARFMEQQEAIALADETVEEEGDEPVPEPSMSISVKKVEPTKAKTTRISKLRVRKDPESEEEIWEEEPAAPVEEEIPEEIPQEEVLAEAEEETEDEDIRIAPDTGRAPTIDLGGAIRNVVIPQRNTDELSRQAMEDALAYERAYQQAEGGQAESEEDEDADMKIAPDRRSAEPAGDEDMRIITPDADEIRVRTIDAGNRFDTMNLEEETTKYLAGEIVKLMAEEDMEAADATRALPMNSIFHDSIDTLEPHMISKAMEMAKEMNDKRLAEEAAAAASGEAAGDLEEITYEETEELEEIPEEAEEEYPEEGTAYGEEEYPGEEVTEDLEEITYEETEDLEEIPEEAEEEYPEEGAAYEEEYPEEEAAYEEEDYPQEEAAGDLEEITYEETGDLEEIPEEVEEEYPEEEYPQEEVTEDPEKITHEETEEPEEPAAKAPEVEPLVFSQSKPLPKEFIEAVQIVAMEAAKEAAAAAASAAAAAAAKEAASAVAQEAATQAAEVATQAARQAAMEAAHATADAIREIQPLPDETEEAEEASQTEVKEEAAPEQPMVEKQITGQLSFKDIIADWEDAKKANEEKHIEEMKQRVKEQTGPLFADFDAARASRGSDLDMLSPVLDVFLETEDLAQEVEQALNEEIQESEEVYYGSDTEEEAVEEVTEAEEIETAEEAEETAFEEIEGPVVEAIEEVTAKAAPEVPELADKPNSFNTAEINGLEDKLLSALEGQHYDTSNLQAEILQNILKEDEKAGEVAAEESVAEEPSAEPEPAPAAEPPVNSAAVASSGASSAAEAVALAKALAKAEEMKKAREQESSTAAAEEAPAEVTAEDTAPAASAEPEAAVAEIPAESEAAAVEIPTEPETVIAEAAEVSETENEVQPTPQETEPEEEGRLLTREEKDKLGSVAQNKAMQQRFAKAIDNVSLVPLTGNILLTGEKGTDAELTARDLLRIIGTKHPSVLEVMGAFTAEEISGKDIEITLFSLDRGSLIIEQAGDLSTDVCNRIFAKAQTLSSILLIFVDTPENMDKLYRSYPKLEDYFTNRILIDVLDNDGLVKFAQSYANEKEYSIDEMGKLALYNRIEDKQRSDHAVTVDEVKQIVDEAIGKADKKSVGHLMDIVFAKRYDKEDMIVLREKDFME